MSATNVDFARMKVAVDKCCKTEEECGPCTAKAKCLIGFAQIAIDYAVQKTAFRIPQGSQLIPRDDVRIFYQEDIRRALLEVLIQCQNCEDSHEDDCVINVIRLALETALIGDNLEYQGSAFSYLLQFARKDPGTGQALLEEFKTLKNID